MRLAIVGPGRLGRSLDVLWRRAGHDVTLVGRGVVVPDDADAVLLAVPDRALPEVATTIAPYHTLLHASGASALDVLGNRTHRGSLHPLMTFPGPDVAMPDLTGVAAAVDGSDDATVTLTTSLARDLGLRPVRVPGDRRLYHASAVIAGNFATLLLVEAGRVLAAAGVDPREARAMLAPLAVQSLLNGVDDPARAITGPAARGDHAVLDAHRAALRDAGLADALAVYDLLSERVSILRS